jgi:hypothetical protein
MQTLKARIKEELRNFKVKLENKDEIFLRDGSKNSVTDSERHTISGTHETSRVMLYSAWRKDQQPRVSQGKASDS